MKPDARAEGRRWLAQAENDLAFAALASREGYFAQACFNSQQAAEKALKAFLYSRGAEQVFGHSVADLAAECTELDAEFASLRSRAAPLDQFYVATRYPNSLPGGIPAQAFARPEAERALEMAREVMAAVKHRLAPAEWFRLSDLARSWVMVGAGPPRTVDPRRAHVPVAAPRLTRFPLTPVSRASASAPIRS